MRLSSTSKKLIFYGLIILVAAYFMPVEKNWTQSYSNDHNWPYGADVTRDAWQDLFPENDIIDSELPFYNTIPTLDTVNRYTYIVFDRYLHFDSLELSSLLNFVEKGNSVFFSAFYLDDQLVDTLGITQEDIGSGLSEYVNGLQVKESKSDFFDTQDSAFTFTIKANEYYFTTVDSVESNMLALGHGEDEGEISFARFPYGEGFVYLHNQPLLFTNYYILSDEGKRFIEKLASYLPSNDIIWDKNHKAINDQIKVSPMNVVLKHPALRWAYWLTIITLLLLFIFRIKRRQRIIPIVEPPANDSLDFTKTIGQLYFNTSDNRTLALKKISVLKEYMASNLLLNDITFDKSEVKELANKTGHDSAFVIKMFKMVSGIPSMNSISNAQLKVLNSMINKFMNR